MDEAIQSTEEEEEEEKREEDLERTQLSWIDIPEESDWECDWLDEVLASQRAHDEAEMKEDGGDEADDAALCVDAEQEMTAMPLEPVTKSRPPTTGGSDSTERGTVTECIEDEAKLSVPAMTGPPATNPCDVAMSPDERLSDEQRECAPKTSNLWTDHVSTDKAGGAQRGMATVPKSYASERRANGVSTKKTSAKSKKKWTKNRNRRNGERKNTPSKFHQNAESGKRASIHKKRANQKGMKRRSAQSAHRSAAPSKPQWITVKRRNRKVAQKGSIFDSKEEFMANALRQSAAVRSSLKFEYVRSLNAPKLQKN